MNLKPNSIAELAELLACANSRGEKVTSVDLSVLNRVLEHKAEDMTATVEAGLSLATFQTQLRKRGQWLPIDPPLGEKLSIADLLANNLSGPRRFGYGTIGDYLIGMKVVLADGRVICSGGKVVKNVAGYDLAKLFIGGRGTLGIIVEATFKLRPLSGQESFVQKMCASRTEAETLIRAVLDSELTPIVLDLHNVGSNGNDAVVIGFAGTADDVEWQLSKAKELGISQAASLDYENQFWSEHPTAHKYSVLPSKLMDAIGKLDNATYVARAGNGVLFHTAKNNFPNALLPAHLFKRVKDEFDPKHILPQLDA